MSLTDALCDGWQAVSKGVTQPNACILATRTGIEALRYFNIQAKPVPVALTVFNKAYVEWQAAGAPEPMPPEVHSIGVDPDVDPSDPRITSDPNNGFAGHVTIVADGDVLIDLTLTQANRPKKGIELSPLITNVPVNFTDIDGWMVLRHVTSCEIAYKPRMDIVGYKDSADWRKNYKHLVGPLIRYMKGVTT